jgi:hypothetical protein
VSRRDDALSHAALVLLGGLLLLLAAEQHGAGAAWVIGVVFLGVGARGLLVILTRS